MATENLTDKMLRNTPEPQERIEIRDAIVTGLVIRISPRSKPDREAGREWAAVRAKRSAWSFSYRWQGQRQRRHIGKLADWKLADAREEARRLRRLLDSGIDPVLERKERRLAQTTKRKQIKDETVSALIDRYLKDPEIARLRTFYTIRQTLNREVKPSYGAWPIRDITAAHVKAIRDKLFEEGKGVASNRALQMTRRFLEWCADRDIIDANPARGISHRYKEPSRDRILSDDEIVQLWKGCEAAGYPYGHYVKSLLLLGQRRNETGLMRWQDISGDLWVIPAEVFKTGIAHTVPLPQAAVALLEDCRKRGAYVFSTKNAKPINAFNKIKMAIEKKTGPLPGGQWGFHDLRRTLTSGMARLGIAPHICDAVIGHKSGTIRGVARVYNRFDYLPERRRALEVWAAHVDGLINGRPDNVKQFPALERAAQ